MKLIWFGEFLVMPKTSDLITKELKKITTTQKITVNDKVSFVWRTVTDVKKVKVKLKNNTINRQYTVHLI